MAGASTPGASEADLARAYGWARFRAHLWRRSWMLVLLAAVLVSKHQVGVPFNGTDLLVIFVAAGLVWHTAHLAFVPGPDDELAWRAAVAERRWGDARSLLGRLDRLRTAEEVALMRARVLAGLGRAAEAQRIVGAVDRAALPPGDFYAGVAAVFDAAGDPAGRRRALEEAQRSAPNPRDLLLALAELALTHDRDPAAARAWLDRIHERARLSPTSARMRALEGMIAFEEGDPEHAQRALEDGLGAAEAERAQTLEMADLVPVVNAYLALTAEARGRPNEARIAARHAAPDLARRRDRALLDRLRGLAAAASARDHSAAR